MYAWILLFFIDVINFYELGFAAAASFAVFVVYASGGIGSWVGGILADRWGRTNTTILLMAISGTCADPYWIGISIEFIPHIADRSHLGNHGCGRLSTVFHNCDGDSRSILRRNCPDSPTSGRVCSDHSHHLVLPFMQEMFSWRWAFALLAIGPIVGIGSMLRLKSSPESAKIGGGKG